VDIVQDLQPGQGGVDILKLPSFAGLVPCLGLLPLHPLAEGRPLNLILGHPGEALGDQRGEDPTEESSSEGGDDHGSPENSLDGGLAVQGGERLGLWLVEVVVILCVVRTDGSPRGGSRDLNVVAGVSGDSLVRLADSGQNQAETGGER